MNEDIVLRICFLLFGAISGYQLTGNFYGAFLGFMVSRPVMLSKLSRE